MGSVEDWSQIEILLAEDNSLDAELTLRALQKHHFANKVHWVKDGEEALDYLFATGPYAGREGGLPNLILLDIKMPKVDGIDVLRRLRGDERTRLIPVVVMTSSTQDKDIIESYRLGVNSYVVKPVQFGAFAETVSTIGFYWVLTNKAAR
jgi:two-component system, response regulator